MAVAKDGKVAEVEKTHQGLQEGNDINLDGKGYVAIRAEGSFLTFNSTGDGDGTGSRSTNCDWTCGRTDQRAKTPKEWCGNLGETDCKSGNYYATMGAKGGFKKSQCEWGYRCKSKGCRVGCHGGGGQGVEEVETCTSGCGYISDGKGGSISGWKLKGTKIVGLSCEPVSVSGNQPTYNSRSCD